MMSVLPFYESRRRGAGADDSHWVKHFELGLVSEPVVDMALLGREPDFDMLPAHCVLYRECLSRLLADGSLELGGGVFVGDLEHNGAIGLLDGAVVDLALDRLEASEHLRLGCNISPFTLADPQAWARIIHALSQRSPLARRLTLEITETAPLDQVSDAALKLRNAQSYGCRLAIDDFGAGFAIGNRFQMLDVDWDIIKIDRSYLGDLRKSPAGRDGLASMIALARCHAPIVVVEGIETIAHLNFARSSGARFGQGWLFEAQSPDTWSAVAPNVADAFNAALKDNAAIGDRPQASLPQEAPAAKAAVSKACGRDEHRRRDKDRSTVNDSATCSDEETIPVSTVRSAKFSLYPGGATDAELNSHSSVVTRCGQKEPLNNLSAVEQGVARHAHSGKRVTSLIARAMHAIRAAITRAHETPANRMPGKS